MFVLVLIAASNQNRLYHVYPAVFATNLLDDVSLLKLLEKKHIIPGQLQKV